MATTERRVVKADRPVESVPEVRVSSRGRVSQTMEYIAQLYKDKHKDEGREVRWVYAPLHRPELSNVIGRRMDGWTEIALSEIPEAATLLGLKVNEAEVRLGDVVLMWTTKENRARLKREETNKAQSQVEAIDRAHYEAMESLTAPGMGEEHKVRSRGRTSVEMREIEVDYEQRSEEREEE